MNQGIQMDHISAFCSKCQNYDKDIGVCSQLHENVLSYPKKFYSKCNGKLFIDNTRKLSKSMIHDTIDEEGKDTTTIAKGAVDLEYEVTKSTDATFSNSDEIVQHVIGKDKLRAVYSGKMEIKEKGKGGLRNIIPDWLLGLGVIGLIGLAFAINTHLGEILLFIVLILVGIGAIYAVIIVVIYLLKWLGGDRDIPDTMILAPKHLYVVRGLSYEAKTNSYKYSDFLKMKIDSIRIKIKSLSEHYAILNSKAVKIKLKRKNIDKADTKFFKHNVLPLNHFIYHLSEGK